MSRMPERENPADAPSAGGDGGTGSGEGADTALQAMLRKRKVHLHDFPDSQSPPEGLEPTPAPKP
jgi:hypothetical protein